MKFHTTIPKILFVAASMVLALCTSNGQSVKFSNKTSLLKYVQGTMPYAKCGVDLNRDGLDDVVRFSKKGIHVDFQQTDQSFTYKFYAISLVNLPLWSVCAGDINGDYYTDFLLGGANGVSTLYYRGSEDRFEESPIKGKIFCQRSTLHDINGDDHLDAFVCNDDGLSQVCENDTNGKLIPNPQLLITSDLPGNYSAIWTDYDNDGNTDLYITKCRVDSKPGDEVRTNLLYKNNGDGTFTEVAKIAGVADNAQSWSTAIEDYDNDGDMDFFIINHDENNKFFRNNGNGTFTEIIESTGIDKDDLGAYENLTGDFNNDGNIDIISDLKSELYLGKGDLTFEAQDLPFKAAAIADFNNDGFLDVTQRSQLWINEGNKNHWVKFKLFGNNGNTNGIDAKVKIVTSKGVQIRELRSGQSYSPMGTLDVHFGLGRDSTIDSLVVFWPTGWKTTATNLTVDTTYKIAASSCILPSENLSLPDTLYLCKGDTLPLSIKNDYEFYHWSNGDSNSSTYVTKPGQYFVIYLDSMLCGAVSKSVKVIQADAVKPKVKVIGTSTELCEGENLLLEAEAKNPITWNDGNKSKMINVTSSGKYYFAEDAMCGNGKFYSDTVDVTVNAFNTIEIDSITYTSDSLRIFLNGSNCTFYDNPLTNDILFEGCEYTIARPSEDILLYVEQRVALPNAAISCGKVDTAGFRLDFFTQKQMYFTLWDSITLDAFDMYVDKPSSKGVRNIIIKDSIGNMFYEKNHTLLNGKNTLSIGVKLYPGRYILACDRSDQLMNVGPQDYPFPIGDVGTIDSSSVSLDLYPYFYNWQVSQDPEYCNSQRIPIGVYVVGTTDVINEKEISFYPNPASDLLTIKGLDETQSPIIEVKNMQGENVNIKYMKMGNTIEVDTKSLISGLYTIFITTKMKTIAKKIIIAKN